MTLTERFWAKVDRSAGPDGCWPFIGACNHDGYGLFSTPDALVAASRVAWEITVGLILGGLWVLHHCDNPPCCNPTHLFLGTNSDNQRDSVAKGRHWATRKTACRQGHPYSGRNLYVVPATGHRQCRACKAATTRRRYWRDLTAARRVGYNKRDVSAEERRQAQRAIYRQQGEARGWV